MDFCTLTLKTLILLPALPFFITWLSNIVHRKYLLVQDSFGQLSGITQENISGIRVIKSYVQEKNQISIFNKSSANWRDLNLKVAWAETFMHPVMEFCVTVGVVILLYSGSRDIVSGALTIGAFVAFQRYISKMVWPMTAVGWGFSLIAQGRASLDRIDEFLNTPLDVTPPPKPLIDLDLDGPIEVRSLSFKYPGSENFALKDISFEIRPGETLGFVGHVGSGKTTLAQLLCHLYEVERGKIFVNRNDTRDIPLDQLENIFHLFHRTHFYLAPLLQRICLSGWKELHRQRFSLALRKSQNSMKKLKACLQDTTHPLAKEESIFLAVKNRG